MSHFLETGKRCKSYALFLKERGYCTVILGRMLVQERHSTAVFARKKSREQKEPSVDQYG